VAGRGQSHHQLQKAARAAEEWQAATVTLMLVATLGGLTTFARICVINALNRHACEARRNSRFKISSCIVAGPGQ
jgi:hypothetical protein